MSRSGGQSEVRSPVFKSPSKLGTHFSRPTAVGMKGRVDLAQLESGPVVWKRDTLPLDHWGLQVQNVHDI
ncbi:hypothetical protein TNCV_4046971 [Trichonephila clavipes]|nr:hypothetical protein TNCV_4046971 [Trichonephila clavipes]